MTTKKELRQMLRQQRQQYSAAEASAVISHLKENPHFLQARILLLYSALPDEVPTQTLLDELVAEGKTVLLPRVTSDTEMELRRYTSTDDLQAGAFGIMEPTGKGFTDYETIEVAVVPGMAFDRKGHRLGRGKGYYDRFLTKIPNTYKIGVCYPSRLLDHMPTDDNDVLMDEVIS